ncbi:MAG: LptF/LptG family permease [Candidatus Sericytochromatia bacterium]|uniref:LptF/LptG family permease n=1 Tax=Candidatus Tanganyikabacteria bacterium TaxID=2961651 RepID=A0A937X3Q4_9BACT|nr:LptF/LptG family permease [Candidatus Tanganyikabacteria bacterium]
MTIGIPVIDRYVVRELIRPFFSGIAAFVMMNLVNLLYIYASLIVQSQVPVDVVVKLLLYNLPAIMVITFPVAYMFAVLVGIGRLARDSEITALRACGISFRRMCIPVVALSLVVSAFGFVFNDRVVPWANRQVVDLVRNLMLKQPKPLFKDNTFFKGAGNRYFYVKQIDQRSNQLYDVIVFDREGQIPVVITAKMGTWRGFEWELIDGIEHRYDKGAFVEAEVPFKARTVRVDKEPQSYFKYGNLSPQEQTSGELGQQIKDLKTSGVDTKSMEVDYHLKFSLPLAATVVAILAAPLGFRFGRLGIFIGVSLTIALVAVYYVIMSIARSMGNAGMLQPFLAAWTENLLYTGVGALLLWRVDRK